jgi:hypothetical protein
MEHSSSSALAADHNPPELSVGEQPLLNYRHIIAGKYAGVTEIPLPFTGLFGKDMAKVLLFILYLAGSGKGIALGGAFFSFHFRHR